MKVTATITKINDKKKTFLFFRKESVFRIPTFRELSEKVKPGYVFSAFFTPEDWEVHFPKHVLEMFSSISTTSEGVVKKNSEPDKYLRLFYGLPDEDEAGFEYEIKLDCHFDVELRLQKILAKQEATRKSIEAHNWYDSQPEDIQEKVKILQREMVPEAM
jgi:hypothetical protein